MYLFKFIPVVALLKFADHHICDDDALGAAAKARNNTESSPTVVLQDTSRIASCGDTNSDRNMEANAASHEQEDQDEYVLLDLDGVSNLINLPPNANYVLTGLDTLNPGLIIDDKFKLSRANLLKLYRFVKIGEYEETIGTCLAFTEQGYSDLTLVVKESIYPVVHEETGSSEVNLFSGTRLIDSSQPPTKQVKPLCQLHKFYFVQEGTDNGDSARDLEGNVGETKGSGDGTDDTEGNVAPGEGA
ncbi:unnamed protein product [Sphenostylis stenocarpa]|uniref:Uncharacterized protein n=1 Tax=Sphenostylis stenocarpa TaxID=92480 RepID=A0AA86T0H8_9FABA|nr:unnamed protein product [Sphenostylis stenocarpa]